MKNKAILLLTLLSLSGCATWSGMSENEKQTAMWVGGFIVTAAVISNANGDTTTTIINECIKHKKAHDCN